MGGITGPRSATGARAKATVFVVDGWDPDSNQSFVAVFWTSKAAAAALARLQRKYPKAYAGMVKRSVR